ncbi:hypothetical protein C8F04DRAFT_1349618 [Mycena alexandri]|uniref:Uncharacterized protein n=1 Tax=Mycena alexandri TaxID=1745969 RepID=A0AAD6X2K8_9AGAR|nr:hypothetical protein C8F04DRAFT_1349618 [Mycena alexandri]
MTLGRPEPRNWLTTARPVAVVMNALVVCAGLNAAGWQYLLFGCVKPLGRVIAGTELDARSKFKLVLNCRAAYEPPHLFSVDSMPWTDLSGDDAKFGFFIVSGSIIARPWAPLALQNRGPHPTQTIYGGETNTACFIRESQLALLIKNASGSHSIHPRPVFVQILDAHLGGLPLSLQAQESVSDQFPSSSFEGQ